MAFYILHGSIKKILHFNSAQQKLAQDDEIEKTDFIPRRRNPHTKGKPTGFSIRNLLQMFV
jgi:hypothetical protein